MKDWIKKATEEIGRLVYDPPPVANQITSNEWAGLYRIAEIIARHAPQDELWQRLRKATGKVTSHWLEIAAERIAAGEPELEVMADYGYHNWRGTKGNGNG